MRFLVGKLVKSSNLRFAGLIGRSQSTEAEQYRLKKVLTLLNKKLVLLLPWDFKRSSTFPVVSNSHTDLFALGFLRPVIFVIAHCCIGYFDFFTASARFFKVRVSEVRFLKSGKTMRDCRFRILLWTEHVHFPFQSNVDNCRSDRISKGLRLWIVYTIR